MGAASIAGVVACAVPTPLGEGTSRISDDGSSSASGGSAASAATVSGGGGGGSGAASTQPNRPTSGGAESSAGESGGLASGGGGGEDGTDAGIDTGGESGVGGSGGIPASGGSTSNAGAGAAATGGSGGSGGSGGVTNSGDFFGASRCSADFDLCEDFEGGSLDTDRWTTRGPVPVIETTRAARGNYSAHFHTVDNGLSMIRQTETFPAANHTYYARVFAWFDAMPTEPAWAHWTISGAEGSGNEAEIRIGGQWDGNFNRWGVGTDYGPTGDWTRLDRDPGDEPLPVPEKQWVCIEWRLDGTSHEIRFWWDDVEHPSLLATRDDHGGTDVPFELPAFESAWFGWWLYQPETSPEEFDVWLDEIVVDDEPIGCSN